MKQPKQNKNFLEEAIKGLSKEEFDKLVCIFQIHYWGNTEVVVVDGSNDGGSDIKVFKDKKEIKRCIQITVQKEGLGLKLNSDLRKVSKKIEDYGYLNRFEFYCSTSISENNIEKYKKDAIDNYNISLEIYDCKRLAQIHCREVIDYIYSLHSDIILKPEQMNIDKARKTLYDLLANGRDSSDIKNSLVDSVIISILYEKESLDIIALNKELEIRLGKNLPDIQHSINRLKSARRIKKDPSNPKLMRLSDSEYDNVKDVLALSTKEEKYFYNQLSIILSKYKINFSQVILDKLKGLYRSAYSNYIDDKEINDDSTYKLLFESFKNHLLRFIDDKNNIELLIGEIKDLCTSNSYLNKICASESFLSLYRSNKLERYLNQKHKDIYFDTPTFIYLLCYYYGIEENDWDNPFYRSVKSLITLKDLFPDKITFYVTSGYMGEVVGEIKKALIFSQFEDYPFFNEFGVSSNTIFNYYQYLKKENLFDKEEKIESFKDFMESFGLENVEPKDYRFYKDANIFLKNVLDGFDIQVVRSDLEKRYLHYCKSLYERILNNKCKKKTSTAIANDVKQVIRSLEHETDNDCYLASWDSTISLFRDKMLKDEANNDYNYFYICNPARLSNKIALENFNIKESALTNDIFAYADKNYDISNRVKNLLELLSPFLQKGNSSRNLLRKLSRIRAQQIEQMSNDNDGEREEKQLPIEEIMVLLIPSQKDQLDDKRIMEKFTLFMNSENNSEYIIDIINKMSQLDNFYSYDLSEYFNKIKSIDLS